LPKITEPVDLLEIPEPPFPESIEAPVIKLPAVPTASAYSKLKLRRRRPAPPAVVSAPTPPPATQEPVTSQPDVPLIGSLSSGGDTSPRAQQEAAGLIAANERRINTLPAKKVEAEKVQLNKVRNFQKQAQDALSSGDTEGAKTLATKAKLVLDDIDRL
jgi:ribosomal protein S20